MSTSAGKSREKPLAAVAAAVVVGVFIFTIIIEPQLKQRKLRLAHMRRLQLELTKMRGDLLIKDRIDDAYSQIEPLIISNGTEQQEISLFTRELSDFYSRLNVKIRAVKILPTVAEEFYRRLSIKIEMSGHISDILKFVSRVETCPNSIKIEQFNLKAQEIVDHVESSFLITKVVSKLQA